MKKVLLRSPILGNSGYSEHSRTIFRALKTAPEEFDIFIEPIAWGQSSWLWEDDEERREIDQLIGKTTQYVANKGKFDIAILVTIPNEWERLAPLTIGVTAGIETNKVSSEWLQKANGTVDRIIVPSQFSVDIFKDTSYKAQDQFGNKLTLKLETPIEAIGFPVRKMSKDTKKETLPLTLDFDFNFLCVAQMGPRKNLDKVLEAFYKTFRDKEVGLVLKVSKANNCVRDRYYCEEQLKEVAGRYPNAKCKMYLLHGYLTENEMHSLYVHPRIKAIVGLGSECWGLPLFEAVYSGLPVITHSWGGQMDFLKFDDKGKMKEAFAKVDYTLAPIPKMAVWNGVLDEDSLWAAPRELSTCQKMSEVFKDYGRFRGQARRLQEYVRDRFEESKVYEQIVSSVLNEKAVPKPESIDGISFCIPTNGKRPEKTKLLLKSIRKQVGKQFEIILCGDIDNFTDETGVILIDQKEAAHSRKVALLRNKAAEMARFGVIAWCDDDILLDSCWMANTLEHSKKNGWNVLGNVMLNPDGTRQWDRATLNPHVLVDYDDRSNNNMYQSSGFFLARRKVWKDVKWDETKLVYADRDSQSIPEDVQYSLDCQKAGYILSFNKDALVWHNDENYTAINNVTLLKSAVLAQVPSYPFLGNSLKYLKIIGELENV